jgi:hypothetical protein
MATKLSRRSAPGLGLGDRFSDIDGRTGRDWTARRLVNIMIYHTRTSRGSRGMLRRGSGGGALLDGNRSQLLFIHHQLKGPYQLKGGQKKIRRTSTFSLMASI